MPQLRMDLLRADCHTKWMSSVGLISSRKYLRCIHQEELSSISSHFHSAPRALVVAASLHLTCSHKKNPVWPGQREHETLQGKPRLQLDLFTLPRPVFSLACWLGPRSYSPPTVICGERHKGHGAKTTVDITGPLGIFLTWSPASAEICVLR